MKEDNKQVVNYLREDVAFNRRHLLKATLAGLMGVSLQSKAATVWKPIGAGSADTALSANSVSGGASTATNPYQINYISPGTGSNQNFILNGDFTTTYAIAGFEKILVAGSGTSGVGMSTSPMDSKSSSLYYVKNNLFYFLGYKNIFSTPSGSTNYLSPAFNKYISPQNGKYLTQITNAQNAIFNPIMYESYYNDFFYIDSSNNLFFLDNPISSPFQSERYPNNPIYYWQYQSGGGSYWNNCNESPKTLTTSYSLASGNMPLNSLGFYNVKINNKFVQSTCAKICDILIKAATPTDNAHIIIFNTITDPIDGISSGTAYIKGAILHRVYNSGTLYYYSQSCNYQNYNPQLSYSKDSDYLLVVDATTLVSIKNVIRFGAYGGDVCMLTNDKKVYKVAWDISTTFYDKKIKASYRSCIGGNSPFFIDGQYLLTKDAQNNTYLESWYNNFSLKFDFQYIKGDMGISNNSLYYIQVKSTSSIIPVIAKKSINNNLTDFNDCAYVTFNESGGCYYAVDLNGGLWACGNNVFGTQTAFPTSSLPTAVFIQLPILPTDVSKAVAISVKQDLDAI